MASAEVALAASVLLAVRVEFSASVLLAASVELAARVLLAVSVELAASLSVELRRVAFSALRPAVASVLAVRPAVRTPPVTSESSSSLSWLLSFFSVMGVSFGRWVLGRLCGL